MLGSRFGGYGLPSGPIFAPRSPECVLIFAARETRVIKMLFQEFGARTILLNERIEAIKVARTAAIDGALLNAAANSEDLFEISEALSEASVPFLFATHSDDAPAPRFDGCYFPANLHQLRTIVGQLFRK